MNNYLVNSNVLKANFIIDVIRLHFSTSVSGLTKFTIRKVLKAFSYGFLVVSKSLAVRPDLVYFTFVPTGFAFYRDAYYLLLLKIFNRKIVLHLHGKGISAVVQNSSVKKYIYKSLLRNTQIICLSQKLSTDISEVYESEPFIVPNGIQVQTSFKKSSLKLQGSQPTILFLSNYTRSKGILILIEALQLVKKQGQPFKARLVGAPFDLSINFLDNYAKSYDVADCVEIVGPRHDKDKFIEYKNSDLFVLPTSNDAFPLVVLEAMQFSLPVIATSEGGIPEIVVDNETGLLVEKHNVQMLADKICFLLSDENKRIEMGKQGYKRFVNNYTLGHFVKNIENVFMDIVLNHKGYYRRSDVDFKKLN